MGVKSWSQPRKPGDKKAENFALSSFPKEIYFISAQSVFLSWSLSGDPQDRGCNLNRFSQQVREREKGRVKEMELKENAIPLDGVSLSSRARFIHVGANYQEAHR